MDIDILLWINEHWHGVPFFNYLFKYISLLGSVGAIWIGLGVLGLILKKTRRVALIMLIALGVEAFIVDIILKHAIMRPRPFQVDPVFIEFYESINLIRPTSSSFPSGHTASSVTCAIVLLYYYREKATPAAIFALLMAFSRVFLCVHFLSDVIAGFAIGVFVAPAVIIGATFAEKKIILYLDKKRKNKGEAQSEEQKDN